MENEYKYCSALTSDGRFEWLSPVNNPKEIVEVNALEVAPRKEVTVKVVRECAGVKVIRVEKERT